MRSHLLFILSVIIATVAKAQTGTPNESEEDGEKEAANKPSEQSLRCSVRLDPVRIEAFSERRGDVAERAPSEEAQDREAVNNDPVWICLSGLIVGGRGLESLGQQDAFRAAVSAQSREAVPSEEVRRALLDCLMDGLMHAFISQDRGYTELIYLYALLDPTCVGAQPWIQPEWIVEYMDEHAYGLHCLFTFLNTEFLYERYGEQGQTLLNCAQRISALLAGWAYLEVAPLLRVAAADFRQRALRRQYLPGYRVAMLVLSNENYRSTPAFKDSQVFNVQGTHLQDLYLVLQAAFERSVGAPLTVAVHAQEGLVNPEYARRFLRVVRGFIPWVFAKKYPGH